MFRSNNVESLFIQIENNINYVIKESTIKGKELWNKLITQHHADIAALIERLDEESQKKLFNKLPRPLSIKVFLVLPENVQSSLLQSIEPEEITLIFQKMPSDELIDLLDSLKPVNITKYLHMIQHKQRNKIMSLLHLNPESAGRIMNSDALTLHRNFTVKKSISLLQRIDLPKEPSRKIYITNKENILVGYINLEDLILNKPETPLTKIIRKNPLTINVHEDQEAVARKMEHYRLISAPVVDEHHHFLGVITADDILDVVKKEASEDVYKMSGLAPVEYNYFQTPFSKLFLQRSVWLGGLLLLQSLSGFILSRYQLLIQSHLFLSFFYTMLIGTGGNAGNQSATLVIRGLATGEISRKNALRVLLREFGMSIALAATLFVITFIRVYFVYPNVISAIAVSVSLFFIINMSMILGAFIPFLLERFNFDPAHSAAPFLATLMDILGIFIYCAVATLILG